MPTTQFTVPAEVQHFLSGLSSKALTNVIWTTNFDDGDLFPTNPSTTRRSLLFDKVTLSDEATPSTEYQVFIMNLDGSSVESI